MAVVQLRRDTDGRRYYQRKLAAGKTPMEATRALKRRLSDIVYKRMVADARRIETGPGGHVGATLQSSAADPIPMAGTLAAVVRARTFDDWARSFLAEHCEAVVLNLGCGLDARVHRVDPPGTVDWYDLDYPAVTNLRQQLLPPREHCTLLGSDVTDLTWLRRIPRDRPTLVIAEGLVPYLTEAGARLLLTSIVDAFPTGQMAFDTVSVSAWRASKWDPLGRKYGALFHCGFDDPTVLADWHRRLEYIDEAPMNDSPVLMAKAPPGVRRMYRLMNLLPAFKRSSRIVRFRF